MYRSCKDENKSYSRTYLKLNTRASALNEKIIGKVR